MDYSIKPLDLPKSTLANQVRERIREAILNRVLPPGKRIDQNKLAEDLSVSLVPVREALKSLEAEGLISIIPRRGAYVTEISQEHLDDLYFCRQLIEGEAVYHAVPHLTEDDFAHLHALMEQMQAATQAGDLHHFMQLNRSFHMRIYQAIGNQHLLQTIQSLWERSELYRYRYMFVAHNAAQVHAEHAELVAALEQRDAARAREIAKRHIHNTQLGLHQQIEAEFKEQG